MFPSACAGSLLMLSSWVLPRLRRCPPPYTRILMYEVYDSTDNEQGVPIGLRVRVSFLVPRIRRLVSRVSCFMSRVSYITSRASCSCLVSQISCVMSRSRVACLLSWYNSCLVPRTSFLVYRLSCLVPRTSCLVCIGSRFSYLVVSCLVSVLMAGGER